MSKENEFEEHGRLAQLAAMCGGDDVSPAEMDEDVSKGKYGKKRAYDKAFKVP